MAIAIEANKVVGFMVCCYLCLLAVCGIYTLLGSQGNDGFNVSIWIDDLISVNKL